MPDNASAPAASGATGRLSAQDIYSRATTGAEEELGRPPHNLFFSGLASGLSMGLSGLTVAVVLSVAGTGPVVEALAYLAYPIGFVIVILGRQQLFTENTLFPVTLVLHDRRRYFWPAARLWAVVLGGNLLGNLLFAILVVATPAVPTPVARELETLGAKLGQHDFWTIFWTGIIAGWMVALVAWLVTASTDTVGQVAVIILITYPIGLAGLAHSIAGGAEVLSAAVGGQLSATASLTWIAAAVLGNMVGGVGMVTLLNFGQVHGGDGPEADE